MSVVSYQVRALHESTAVGDWQAATNTTATRRMKVFMTSILALPNASESERNPNQVRLPEPCRASLAGLFAAKQQAERDYNIALNHAVAALGVDVTKKNEVNLDTGLVTLGEE
jgi:hypothetical protein